MLYQVAWIILQLARPFFKTVGKEKTQCCKEGACIIIANHEGVLDPWKIGPHFARNVQWFCKQELYSFEHSYNECVNEYKHSHIIAWIRAMATVWIVKYSSTIPVDRENPNARINRKAIVRAKNLLAKQGGALGIFPEGGIGDSASKTINISFVKLAKKTGAKILPIKIKESGIVFGPPLSILPSCDDDAKVAQGIMDTVKAL